MRVRISVLLLTAPVTSYSRRQRARQTMPTVTLRFMWTAVLSVAITARKWTTILTFITAHTFALLSTRMELK